MDYTTRWTGWIGFVLGVVVLASYVRKRKTIVNASLDLQRRCVFYAWAASACITAVCFLLVLSLWAMKGNNVTDGDKTARVFVAGLFVFMSGAILWPWVLQAELTLSELSALWVTALGSLIMFCATWWQVMSLPWTSFIFFHHLVIDGLWWPYYGRTTPLDNTNKVGALYIFYFAPLAACIPLSIFGETTWVASLVVVVTTLHFLVGGMVAYPDFLSVTRQRYQQPLAIVADVLITAALVLACVHLANGMKYSWIALIAAMLGNLFCWITRRKTLIPDTTQYAVIILADY